jgi:selenocysteine-specific translation elongation factor
MEKSQVTGIESHRQNRQTTCASYYMQMALRRETEKSILRGLWIHGALKTHQVKVTCAVSFMKPEPMASLYKVVKMLREFFVLFLRLRFKFLCAFSSER